MKERWNSYKKWEPEWGVLKSTTNDTRRAHRVSELWIRSSKLFHISLILESFSIEYDYSKSKNHREIEARMNNV